MNIQRKLTAGAISVAAIACAVLGASPASATGQGSCDDTVDACLYYNSNYAGPKYGDSRGSTSSVHNYSGTFSNGYAVKNNAASVKNLNFNYNVRIYYNSNFGGPSQLIKRDTSANLNATLKNNNASQCFDTFNVCPVN
ncbi:peptidase inhibitor family I36 protein [Streptomyces sp. RKAG290]|uniref:peptidase inhibitor family I36 protein n=1 Tax=Streptomyces sp. RKAG290 TaxID=2888348 RepID=UPI002033B414|nr:peptidase inhibitor family I36 protein [Streptomyces sp. RKAG290]MCM2411034.1 peptidase inhibitor family I36 protein [Streptomyces sp. RKAG290]